MGKIVLEDFNEGNGYYKVNLAYLNKEQVEEIENLVSKWNPTDEDIKSCIAMCLTDVNEQRFKDYGTNLRDRLAWLERQGEQKPTKEKMITPEESLGIDSETYNKIVDECIYGEWKPTNKIEPKFREGEWITNGDYTWKIVEVKPLDYILQSQDGNIVDDTISHVDEQFHSFTIEDVKDGDVLATLDHILIFEKLLPKDGGVSYCHYDFGCSTPQFNFNKDDNWYFGKEAKVYPATKEQRDLLFQKMKEAGYEWDAENKQLNKIYIVHNTYCQENCKGFQETGKCFTDGNCKAKEEAEQKLAENDDEKIRKGLIGILSKCKYFYSKKIAWLKKQDKSSDEDMKTLLRTEYEKGRADVIAEMQKEWNKEDERMYRGLHNLIYSTPYCDSRKELSDWLESLKDRIQPQPKQEWSEEDEKIINGLIDSLTRISLNTRTDSTSPNYTFYKEINWLKSLRSAAIWYLKKRNIQPQPKQKWNEEDEKMLSLIIDNLNFICDTIDKYVVDVGSFEGLIIWLKSLKSQIDWLKSFKGGIMIELKGKVAERFEKEREKAEKSPKTDVTENVEIVRQIVSETLKEE